MATLTQEQVDAIYSAMGLHDDEADRTIRRRVRGSVGQDQSVLMDYLRGQGVTDTSLHKFGFKDVFKPTETAFTPGVTRTAQKPVTLSRGPDGEKQEVLEGSQSYKSNTTGEEFNPEVWGYGSAMNVMGGQGSGFYNVIEPAVEKLRQQYVQAKAANPNLLSPDAFAAAEFAKHGTDQARNNAGWGPSTNPAELFNGLSSKYGQYLASQGVRVEPVQIARDDPMYQAGAQKSEIATKQAVDRMGHGHFKDGAWAPLSIIAAPFMAQAGGALANATGMPTWAANATIGAAKSAATGGNPLIGAVTGGAGTLASDAVGGLIDNAAAGGEALSGMDLASDAGDFWSGNGAFAGGASPDTFVDGWDVMGTDVAAPTMDPSSAVGSSAPPAAEVIAPELASPDLDIPSTPAETLSGADISGDAGNVFTGNGPLAGGAFNEAGEKVGGLVDNVINWGKQNPLLAATGVSTVAGFVKGAMSPSEEEKARAVMQAKVEAETQLANSRRANNNLSGINLNRLKPTGVQLVRPGIINSAIPR